MAMLSSAAWIAHDLGLATAIGGEIFGKVALHPALAKVRSARERDQVAEVAWRRFSWINLAAHGAFAASWLIGRRMLSGREVSHTARNLTRAKDVLIAASLTTGAASVALNRTLTKQTRAHRGPERARAGEVDDQAMKAERAVEAVGALNLLTNAGVAGVTSLLAMEASHSARFARRSRKLP